ncbi:HAMP domain-containing sensor histidine kinase [uncultured Cohaesibacter sp.]|uniref:HAMP domain-containing sensor histidine kinase n=1 Tax=uncultured Cohaesibacter sp. TaxID=1002546 RepID=UPI0029310AD1|nr:HAMP domain-containing sensor histidine kinase [uncultured Cohaesibacter sp.]
MVIEPDETNKAVSSAAPESDEMQPARSLERPRDRAPAFGLSLKLLILTLLFVMLSEILIFVPSISKFRHDWLTRKLELTEVAARIYTKSPSHLMNQELAEDLLKRLKINTLALRTDTQRRMLAMMEAPGEIERDDDIEAMNPFQKISAAFDTLIWGEGRYIRIVGQTADDQGMIELVFKETDLRRDMVAYSINILLLSLVISIMTASLVYLSLRALLVRPILHLLDNMATFSSDPEDGGAVIRPSERRDEIGMTERRLAEMETILAQNLQRQRRLAELGMAVSKINHDLRNIIASAQLFSDRLALLEDPTVQRVVPKLMSALDRAVDYSRSVMSYGKAQEAPPDKRLLKLHQLGQEVHDFLGLPESARIEFLNQVPQDFEIYADPGQLFRVLFNLCRNAADVMQLGAEMSVISRIELRAREENGKVVIEISDTGPGVPAAARKNLFRPFQGSARKGGTGLGLAISAEIIKAHGGSIRLLDRAPGAHFEIRLPKN